MLPEILAGSYARYKEDTSVFTTCKINSLQSRLLDFGLHVLTCHSGLSQAAVACGWKGSLDSGSVSKPQQPLQPLEPNKGSNGPSKRLKGKARKQAEKDKSENKTESSGFSSEPGVKHTITTKDLLRQAEVVAGRINMPTGLRRVLERAIHARQRCAEWFQTSMVENKYSNEGHQHFIEVLEQTLDILGTHKAPRGNRAQAHSMDKK
jgi:hypothetical protein